LVDNNDIMRVCEVFSNIKEFRCCLPDLVVFSMTLRELSKLREMVFFIGRRPERMRPYFFSDECESEINQTSLVVAHGICTGCSSFSS